PRSETAEQTRISAGRLRRNRQVLELKRWRTAAAMHGSAAAPPPPTKDTAQRSDRLIPGFVATEPIAKRRAGATRPVSEPRTRWQSNLQPLSSDGFLWWRPSSSTRGRGKPR